MKTFEVTVRVRNNRLKQRRDELGWTQRKMAEEVKVPLSAYCELEGMRRSPIRVTEAGWDWTRAAVRLADFHAVEPGELFPDAVLAISKTSAQVKLDAGDLLALNEPPRRGVVLSALTDAVADVMTTLAPREQDVLRLRFGLDGDPPQTLSMVGESMGVGQERIRQIEAQALRKLRHPSRSAGLVHFADDEDVL